MARIRSVKPVYPQHRKVRAVSRDARLLNIHLWNLADDEGRLQNLPQWILGEVFPGDEDVTLAVLRGWLDELEQVGLLARYEVDGEHYIQIHDWKDHQRIEKPKASELPPPPPPHLRLVPNESGNDPGRIQDDSRPEGKGEEEERKGNSSARAEEPPDSHQEIVRALDAVAFARGAPSPKVPAVLTACAEFAQHDLAAEVAKFAHYWTEGPGERRALADVAWSWRGWLGKVREKPKGKQASGGSGRDSLAEDLAKLKDAHAQAVREEKAEEAAA